MISKKLIVQNSNILISAPPKLSSLLRPCNSILLLHFWDLELSIRHHVTKINQLHDLNLISLGFSKQVLNIWARKLLFGRTMMLQRDVTSQGAGCTKVHVHLPYREANLFYIVPLGLISIFLCVERVKISCRLIPTRSFQIYLQNSYCHKT